MALDNYEGYSAEMRALARGMFRGIAGFVRRERRRYWRRVGKRRGWRPGR